MTIEKAISYLRAMSPLSVLTPETVAIRTILTAYEAQQTVVNTAFEWRDSLIDRPIPKTGAARNLRLALRDYARLMSGTETTSPSDSSEG